MKCPTREENIVHHCHFTIDSAYHAMLSPTLNIMFHLIPAYRHKLKLWKPVEDIKTVKQGSCGGSADPYGLY